MNAVQTKPQEAIKNINIIDGTFSASDAEDILNTMLDKKINFHKIQILKRMEGNHDDPCTGDAGRLEALKLEKKRLSEILLDARISGKRLRLSSQIKMELV